MDLIKSEKVLARNIYTPGLFDERTSEKFLTVKQLADFLNLSVHTIRKWRQNELIPYYKFGYAVRFRASEVLASMKGD